MQTDYSQSLLEMAAPTCLSSGAISTLQVPRYETVTACVQADSPSFFVIVVFNLIKTTLLIIFVYNCIFY